MLLREKAEPPGDKSINDALKDAYPVFVQFIETINRDEYGITGTWNFYKDGKAWLFKASWKNKTIFWLSVWDGFFKVGFYFNDKNGAGIPGLPIDLSLKELFLNTPPIGKLRPLTINVTERIQLDDLLRVVMYKQNCK